jgi:hypothetical protein
MGGKFHLKLNNGERPIANKYREGKMKRTLKRELKVLEIAKREALTTSVSRRSSLSAPLVCTSSWKLCFCERKGGCEFRTCVLVKIHSNSVGEGSEKGRRLCLCYSLITLPRFGWRKE